MNSDTGLWHCFTCGARGNLPILVSQLSGDSDTILAVQRALINNSLTRITSEDDEEEHVEVDWIRYSQFAPLPQSILDYRNLYADTAKLYGVRWGDVVVDHKTGRTEKMTILPIVSPMGVLMGWQGKKTGKFLNVPTGVNKSLTLFGIERAIASTALLVESPLDVVRFAGVYPDMDISPLASFGANVSDAQVKLLTRFDKLILALDNPRIDVAGRMETRRLSKLFPTFRGGVRYWDYSKTDAKDIGDMEDAEILCGALATTVRCP